MKIMNDIDWNKVEAVAHKYYVQWDELTIAEKKILHAARLADMQRFSNIRYSLEKHPIRRQAGA
jgi:hypothetical protein